MDLPTAATPAETPYYQRTVDDILAALGTDPRRGLAGDEARERLRRYGPNALPAPPSVPAWRRFLAQFQDSLTLLLLVATAISFVAWLLAPEHAIPYETLAILAIVLLNGILGYIQESRAEQAVAALKAMAASQARVLRDGHQEMIPATDVVPGDILLIEEGDSIPADGRVIESIAMHVAEASLTGESTPVTKDSAAIPGEVGLGDQENMVFSSTVVVTGRGKAVVTSTGAATQIGRIADSLTQAEEEATPLEKELDWVGKRLGVAVILIALLIAGTLLVLGHVSTFAGVVQVMLLAVSLAVAAVPEGLTAITTVTLSLGVQRMARRHVIVRKLSAVETLGSTSVICTDKTGTLTKNEMTVRGVCTAGGRVELTGAGYAPTGEARYDGRPVDNPELLHELRLTLGAATLVNNANLAEQNGKWTIEGDPTEGALVVAAHKVGLTEAGVEERFPRLGEVPFTSERKMMSTVHTETGRGRMAVTAKGAPDILLARCTHEQIGRDIRPLADARRAEILATVESLAAEALRTLGVAYRFLKQDEQTGEWSEAVERDLVFLGVAGIIDPPRPEAEAAVGDAQRAGVRVIMITGDHPRTAAAVASELGIISSDAPAINGAELQKTDEPALRRIVRDVSIYARVAPEHKLRIVRALKDNGHIVAMTGDGVNDAPALKTADIGVAMGITGTDVSKQAADMILTDDNFASIVAAVEEGRSIFHSIRAALRYLLSSNMGEVLTMFLGVVLAGLFGLVPEAGGVVLPLLAVQILWVNLLTDSGPALAMAMEPPDPRLMQRPPRDPHSRVIDRAMWLNIAFVGLVMALGTLLVLDLSLPGGMLPGSGDMTYARTMAFTTLVFFQLFNIFNARAPRRSALVGLFRNKWVWVAVLFSAALQLVVIYVPFLQTAFGTVGLSLTDWLVCIAIASSVLWLSELAKLIGLTGAASQAAGRRTQAGGL